MYIAVVVYVYVVVYCTCIVLIVYCTVLYGTIVHLHVYFVACTILYYKLKSIYLSLGRLITSKYIPESKYYKWFPQAALANIPLKS